MFRSKYLTDVISEHLTFYLPRCFGPGSIQDGPGGFQEHPKPSNKLSSSIYEKKYSGYWYCLLLLIIAIRLQALQACSWTCRLGWVRGGVVELDGPRPYLGFFAVQSGDAWLPPHLRQTCLNLQSLKVQPFSVDRAVSRL